MAKDDWGVESPDGAGQWERIVVPQGLEFYEHLNLGNATMFRVFAKWVGTGEPQLLVAIEGKGCYTFRNWAHWTYVSEKLSLLEGDARNLADWINTQLGYAESPDWPRMRQGIYRPPYVPQMVIADPTLQQGEAG